MNFYTVSPVRFGFQGQVKQASPLPVTKTQQIKDSVHFGTTTHAYRLVPNNHVDIINNSGQTTRYFVDEDAYGTEGQQLIYPLHYNGAEIGTITGILGSRYSSYTIHPTSGNEGAYHYLVRSELAN